MRILSKRDVLFAIITGLIAGVLGAFILIFLRKTLPFGIQPIWLIPIIPLLWIAGIQLGYFLGRWIGFFDQFGKFAAIGFTNFAVDSSILNLLIFLTGIAEGKEYALFKIISFIVAVVHSYFWNRAWTFQTKGSFAKFLLVMIASVLVNVATASLVVNVIPHGGTSPEVWANVGAIIGSASALIFSFVGFRLVVFK